MRVLVFLASGILEDGSVASFRMNLKIFLEQSCFLNDSVGCFCFRHFGRRFCSLFSYEFIRFFETEWFFSMKVCVFFLASGILEDGSVAFFHMNLYVFLKQNGFFNESVCFFGFKHFGRRFRGLFFHMNS